MFHICNSVLAPFASTQTHVREWFKQDSELFQVQLCDVAWTRILHRCDYGFHYLRLQLVCSVLCARPYVACSLSGFDSYPR